MIALLRALAGLAFALAAVTLIRPRSGWGRLGLFIPKLFAGSYIALIGLLGLGSALAGWLAGRDAVSAGLGIATVAIAARHIARIVRRSRKAAAELPAVEPQSAMLRAPWVLHWREAADTPWQRDVPVGENPGTGRPVLADLWQPPTPARSGLGIVYLHGSGWHYADKDFRTRQFFRHLARQGHVIVDVAYTLAPATDLPGMLADVWRAVGWMRQHAAEWGIRADGIVLMGGSAGGHLALLAAYTADAPVCGVVSYYCPPDLLAQYERFAELPGLTGRTRLERFAMQALTARFGFEPLPVHNLLPSLLGGTPAECPERYEDGSPLRHVSPHCPPTLLLQGLHDFSGAAPEVRKLYAALDAAGCRAVLLELPDTDHGFDLYKPEWSPAAQAATYVTERFLASLNA